MSWDHGYYSQASYISGYFREVAPSWIDFSALVNGIAPGRSEDGASFSYLDLGCGTGYGLCLMAALHPEGSFVGVDFLPMHMARAESLASTLGLSNVRFVEGDFLSLAADPSPLAPGPTPAPRFDYVVSHGVATWVVESVQKALFTTASACLRPGGLFYCSYNCFPGWLARTAVHHLVRLEQQRNDPAVPMRPIRAAESSLLALLGTEDEPTSLARALPGLGPELRQMEKQDPQYLSQEFANAGWQPLYVHQLHERCMAHKLSYVSTANLPELFPQLLPTGLQEAIKPEVNPAMRELLVDLGTNKAFRRDLFTHGTVALTPTARQQALAKLRLRLQEAEPLENYAFNTSFGMVNGNREAFADLESGLAEGPRPVGDLVDSWPDNPDELFMQIAMLLNSGRIGIDRGPAGEAAMGHCRQVNDTLLSLAQEDGTYEWLAAPTIGQAKRVTLVEQLSIHGLSQGMSGELLAGCVQVALGSIGRLPNDADGKPVTEPAKQAELIQEVADQAAKRLPALQSLGVFPA